MTGFDPGKQTTEYGQLDTLLTDGQTPGSGADDLFLNMLDQYDSVTGRDGYRNQEEMVGELLDALNRRLNPIGLDATRSGVVYCNAGGAPALPEVVGAVGACMEQDWNEILEQHADWDIADHAWWMLKDYNLEHGNGRVHLQDGRLSVTMEAPNHTTINLNVPVMKSDEETIGNLKTEMIDRMSRFTADAEFDKLWSPEFAEHNGVTPSGFMKMLKEDETYFHAAGFQMYMDTRPALRELWYSDAQIEGINYTEGYRQTIDADQVMQDGRPAYDMYLFTVDKSTGDSTVPEYVQYEITPVEMETFITGEFEDPDHANREKPVEEQSPALSGKEQSYSLASEARSVSLAAGDLSHLPLIQEYEDRTHPTDR